MSEELKRSKKPSKLKEMAKKRWFAPTIYIASAALILTGVIWYSDSLTEQDPQAPTNSTTDLPTRGEEPSLEVVKNDETIAMPAKEASSLKVKRPFYDATASAEAQEAAVIQYQNTFHENTGVSLGLESNETFDVVASLSGTVSVVETNDVVGNTIEIQHENGVVTVYQSVTDFAVEVGDQVKQGDVIAKANQSAFDQEIGVHVHFELKKDGVKVNPTSYFQKPVSALTTADSETTEE